MTKGLLTMLLCGGLGACMDPQAPPASNSADDGELTSQSTSAIITCRIWEAIEICSSTGGDFDCINRSPSVALSCARTACQADCTTGTCALQGPVSCVE